MRWLFFETTNERPIAVITAATPTIIVAGNTQYFSGYGTDLDGTIVAYRWTSSIAGVISTSASFTTSALSVGNHTISFEVQDNSGTWSLPDTVTVEVNAVVSPDTRRLDVGRMSIGVVGQDHAASVDVGRIGTGVIGQDHAASIDIGRIGTGVIGQDHPESLQVGRLSIGTIGQDFASGSVDIGRMSIGVIGNEQWFTGVDVEGARVDAVVQRGYFGSEDAIKRDIEVEGARVDVVATTGYFGSETSNKRDIEVEGIRIDVVAMIAQP